MYIHVYDYETKMNASVYHQWKYNNTYSVHKGYMHEFFQDGIFIRREEEWGMNKLSYNSTWVADFLASRW